MSEALAGYELVKETRYSVYFAGDSSQSWNIAGAHCVLMDDHHIYINVGPDDIVTIFKAHVVYTRMMTVTMKRKVVVGDTPTPQTPAPQPTLSDA